jgi:hypothetical protein
LDQPETAPEEAMTRRKFHLAVPALVLLPFGVLFVGGWAVTTVEDLPDYAVAGQPVSLTFTVRQHGFRPVDGLKPRVEARAGALTTTALASATTGGRYSTTITLPRPGDWTITIHSGFGNAKTTLVPVHAVAPGSRALPSLTDAERGRRLFVAKGCVTCHVEIRAGPDLSGKRYPPAYLTQLLAEPQRVLPARSGTFPMPDLNLKPREIAALVTYLNANGRVATR